MCNFVIRPIKSYATIDVSASKVVADKIPVAFENIILTRGTAFDVKRVDGGFVYGNVADVDNEVVINVEDFTHTFTASQDDIKKAKEAEAKFFKK